MVTMRISQLAERTGVPATTLRYYEGAGLLPAERDPSGYRRYPEEAVQRLAFIGAAKRLGLPLGEIAGLLAVLDSRPCADVKADLDARIRVRLAEAARRTEELARFTAVAHQALRHLDDLPERDGRCTSECVPPGDLEEQPVACSLSGEGVAERVGEWGRALSGARVERTPHGVVVTAPAERAAELAGLAAAEQRCCPFFDFRLGFHGPLLRLEVQAPEAASGLVAELFPVQDAHAGAQSAARPAFMAEEG